METKKQYTTFGRNLKRLREKNGYTQTKLAELAGVTQRVIEYYEKYAKRPSFDKVKKIANALGVPEEKLLGETFKKSEKQGLSYKIMRKVRVIEELSTRDQNTVFSLINALSEKNKLKKK